MYDKDLNNDGHLFAPWKLFIIGFQLFLISVVFIVYIHYSVTYVRLIAENNWGEFATFVGFMCSCALFATLFYLSLNKRRDIWFVFFAIVTFLIAMEEISWGQTILNFKTPNLFLNFNFQEEVGFHNIRAVSPDNMTYFVVSIGFVVYGFILPVLVFLSARAKRIVQNINFPVPPIHLSPLFIATTYFLNFSTLVKSSEIGELFMSISLSCLALEYIWIDRKLEKHVMLIKWLKKYSIPMYILAILSTGVLLTFLENSSYYQFEYRVKAIVPKLINAGHYKQADNILSFLEKESLYVQSEILFNRGVLLKKLNRKLEAINFFHKALDIELRRSTENPDNLEILGKIARIYYEMGEKELQNRYCNLALNGYTEALNDADSKEKQLKFRMARGEIYETLGQYNKSINEYLTSSVFALTAKSRNEIEWSVGRVFYRCRTGDTNNRKIISRVSWNKIQAMLKLLQNNKKRKKSLVWCD